MNKMSRPIIVTAVDENYIYPLAVMLKSLELNLKNTCAVNVFILYSSVIIKLRNEINCSHDSEKMRIKWVKISHYKINKLKVDGHISVTTYYRLLIEEMFDTADKVIYLDADLVVNRCISELWNTDFNGSHLLAVPNASKKSGYVSGERGLPAYKVLGIPKDSRTFNAGVMIMNLKLWRRDHISSKVLKYLKEYHDYVLWWDQDGLNAILYEKWKPLSAVWNVMTNHLVTFSTWNDSLLSKKEYQNVLHQPAIVHYAGPSKPWHTNYVGPFDGLYFEYARNISLEIQGFLIKNE